MAPYRRFLSPGDAIIDFNCTTCLGPCVPGIYCEYVVLPSPPPISLNDVVGDTTPIAVKSHLVPNLLIAAAAVLSVAFLFLITTYAVHRLRRRRRRSISVTPTDPLPNIDGGDDGGDDGEVDHHVWHIRTVGLDESIIQSIATSVYNSKDGLLDGAADCAVCLADIHDGEVLRLLPKCGHAFHVPCIDTWLRSHLNCPLCRAPILAQNTNSENSPLFFPPPPPDMGEITASVELTQIDVEELEGDQVVPVEEDEIGVNAALASSSSYSAEDGFQPVRRSVSMDSPSLGALLLRAVPEEKFGEETPEVKEEQVIKNGGKQMNAAKWDSPQKGVQGIGRSLSSRSGRFFLSRYGRARNSVLPM